jgi:hypothetical protein
MVKRGGCSFSFPHVTIFPQPFAKMAISFSNVGFGMFIKIQVDVDMG